MVKQANELKSENKKISGRWFSIRLGPLLQEQQTLRP